MATRRKPVPGKNNSVMRLTGKQELFLDALVADPNFNGKHAAMKAGVDEKQAARMASEWLNGDKYPQVQLELEKRMEARRNTTEVKAERIIQELARIAFFNPKRLLRPDGKGMLDLIDMPDDICAVISNISVTYGEDMDDEGNYNNLKHTKFSLHDKMTALNQLANMLGLNSGGAATVINNTTINALVVKWDQLYRSQGPPQPDEIEARIEREMRALPPASPPGNQQPAGSPSGNPPSKNGDDHE